MKMTTEHFNQFQSMLKPFDTPELRSQYANAGLSLKRYQWDVTYKAGLTAFICDVLYQYLDDTHIQTALNKAIKSL